MVDLDKYKNHSVMHYEADTIPSQCNDCFEDCDSCDIAELRWPLSPIDKLILLRKAKCAEVRRLLRSIEQIDTEIEVLKND